MKPSSAVTIDHPAMRFVAPSSIQRGVPLSHVIGRQAVSLLAESLVPVAPSFDSTRFLRKALRGINDLGLMDRAARVAEALAAELPVDFSESAAILIQSLGPELRSTEGNGLAPFFYLPHSQFIFTYGSRDLQNGLNACHELTRRFTAEFCIRPLLMEHGPLALSTLQDWTRDPNPHVRRLVSEGTRSRLPWGIRLKVFQQDPAPVLSLLEALRNDPVPYVYRSVANHVGDLLKDHPETGLEVCERWTTEAHAIRDDESLRSRRLWIVRHALRLPAKQGHPHAVRLRRRAV